MTLRKGRIPEEIDNLLRELSKNESNGGELSCFNLDINIRLSEKDCEEYKESADEIDNIPVNPDTYAKYGIGQSHQVRRTITAYWNSPIYLPEILQEENARGLMLHHDNESSNTAGLTVDFLKQKQIKVIKHPPNSSDQAMCNFWLFFNLKKNLHEGRFHSEEEIDKAINALFL
ncbi:histone-lysine N-methyltransferase SETMAR [Trichonephila clavipes]|nr:histone-lysine N-methyltransferase SETMAR [Trichonephila clavipes]